MDPEPKKTEDTMNAKHERSHYQPVRQLLINSLVWVTLLLIFAGCQKKPLDNFGSTNSFELTSQSGETFSSDSMKGKIWVVSFFFTRCKTICPKLLAHLKSVQEGAETEGIDLNMVSITVDPDHDTPKRLAEKHKEVKAGDNWTFLTGSKEAITEVVVKGFKTHMGEQEILENGLIEIGHGSKLLLIDHEGIIRGLFDTNPEERGQLLNLAKRLKR
jgi:protein SCO1/2